MKLLNTFQLDQHNYMLDEYLEEVAIYHNLFQYKCKI